RGGGCCRRTVRRSRRDDDAGRQSDGATPSIERLAHVALAELEAERPPGSARAVTFRLPLDAVEHDAQRNAFDRPRPDELESRPDNADDVAFVDASEVLLHP